jgi:hypothetical protein
MIDGVRGYVIHGRDNHSSCSIFYSCTGYGSGSVIVDGSYGFCWSSVPEASGGNIGVSIYFSSYNPGFYSPIGMYWQNLYVGLPIRPVQDAK